MTSFETLRVDRKGHVAHVILNRPDRGNAMNAQLFAEISDAFDELDEEPEVRVVMLSGEGKSFCTGLDLTAAMTDFASLVQPGLAGPRQELRKLIVRLQHQTSAPARCGKPVVAAVHGWCIGGGLDLAAACDLRLCSSDARFSLREARVGMVADLGSLQRLPRIIGDAATRELAFTAKDIDAERALRLGLVSAVADTREALIDAALAEAETIAALSPLVVQGVKHIMNSQEGWTVEKGLEHVATWNSAFLQSEDLTEAFSAFMEKRKPEYKGV